MLSKNVVKDIQSLCHKKQRDEQQLFIVEGPKLTEELLKSEFEIVHVYAVKDWLDQNENLIVPATEISISELGKISALQTPNKVLAIAKQKVLLAEPVINDRITIVLDGLQDPGNMGTIIRIADWFGVQQIIASNDTVEVYNPKVVQSTMGSICRVNVWYKDLDIFLREVKIPVYGALLNGTSVYEMNKIKEGIIVIGNESKGISLSVQQQINHAVTIPRIGEAESLNAAVATGIILSHLVGQ